MPVGSSMHTGSSEVFWEHSVKNKLITGYSKLKESLVWGKTIIRLITDNLIHRSTKKVHLLIHWSLLIYFKVHDG